MSQANIQPVELIGALNPATGGVEFKAALTPYVA
jgi:hypothetical protein